MLRFFINNSFQNKLLLINICSTSFFLRKCRKTRNEMCQNPLLVIHILTLPEAAASLLRVFASKYLIYYYFALIPVQTSLSYFSQPTQTSSCNLHHLWLICVKQMQAISLTCINLNPVWLNRFSAPKSIRSNAFNNVINLWCYLDHILRTKSATVAVAASKYQSCHICNIYVFRLAQALSLINRNISLGKCVKFEW